MTAVYQRRISRREALAWLGALGTAALGARAEQFGKLAFAEQDGDISWPELKLAPATADGYGQDPRMNPPDPVPWPRILTAPELQGIARLGEIVCPGSSAAGVPDVVDEWLSAPYPMQQEHRSLIIPGLAWLDSYGESRFGKSFFTLPDSVQLLIIQMLDRPVDDIPQELERPVTFFNTFRFLISGIYFTSPDGVKVLGYLGNVPVKGDYPGPSQEARAHLARVVESLGLEL